MYVISHKFTIGLRSWLHAGQGMGSSIVVHKQWFRSQSMVVTVIDNISFQDLPLISWPVKIMRNASPHHAKCIPTPSQNHRQMEWFPGCCWHHRLHLVASTHEFFHQNVAFIRPMNLSPQCKIPSVSYLTPCQTCYFVCWCQKGTFNRPPGSVPISLQLILYGLHSNCPVGNPVISYEHAAKKGATSNQ